LDLLRIPHRTLTAAHAAELLTWAASEMDARKSPVALLVPPGVVAAGAERAGAESGGAEERSTATGSDPTRVRHAPAATTPAAEREELTPVISRADAIAVEVQALGDEPRLYVIGYICSDAAAVCGGMATS